MRGFRFPETLACAQPQWVFWAIRNHPKNLHSFYIEPNGEMTQIECGSTHTCMCVWYMYTKRYFTNLISKIGTSDFSGSLKFSLRLRKENCAVGLNEICRFSCVLIKCLLFQSSKINHDSWVQNSTSLGFIIGNPLNHCIGMPFI